MKIYLSPSTAGRYGGSLNRSLRNFDRFIQSQLDNLGFKSSFDELWLTLSYPPMYVLPGVIGIEIEHKKYYITFPYSRLNRRYKKIDITLKAPEFSEHFDKAEQTIYQHQFDIESQYKNIQEAELAQILVDKFLEAGEIINSKLKKNDVFDYDLFRRILLNIKHSINPYFLESISSKQSIQEENNRVKRAIELREKRKNSNLPKDKLLKDLRIYYVDLPKKALYPYDYQYTEIFLNLLIKKNFKCPQYNHLYVQVAKTLNDALMNSINIEDWYVYGLATIDFDNYLKQTEKEKENIVVQTIIDGLRDIAIIDDLDISIMNKIFSEVRLKGLDTELEYRTLENTYYKLKITYYSRSMEEQCPIYFNLTEKATNKTKRVQVGKADNSQINLWLQKINLTNKLIKVKSSDSIRAGVYLDDKPKEMVFEIAELLK
ncbi:hypothetical protein [Rufibacter hautae]|uniref:Uncharacterized protein n=1 Tax=Rufibacter hautae TaxID=2595005 RepID=A0A5B6TGL1_9BACT|nr:hypothetical protein [Rufibacter hautae]KAA3438402.1 hypothetical protein FOA19_14270 [Rufibacter hautae]